MAHLLAPTTKTLRGDGALHYSSALFVDPLRSDITALLSAYIDRCKLALSTHEDVHPFEWFKVIWRAQGWCLFHLRCTQARARKVFLETTLRLFLERLGGEEPVLYRLTALFAVYTFFWNQPEGEGIDLYRLPYIPVPIDLYEEIIRLPSLLPPTFDHYATHILLTLSARQAFTLLPPSTTLTQNPAVLPNSTVSIVSSTAGEAGAKGKGGRPTAVELQRRSIRAISALDHWASTTLPPILNSSSSPATGSGTDTAQAYTQSKTTLAASLPPDTLLAAEHSTIAKMKQLEAIRLREAWPGPGAAGDAAGGSEVGVGVSEGVMRLEEAMTRPERLLGLSRAVREAQAQPSSSS